MREIREDQRKGEREAGREEEGMSGIKEDERN